MVPVSPKVINLTFFTFNGTCMADFCVTYPLRVLEVLKVFFLNIKFDLRDKYLTNI